uniref:Sulfotransferase domain-containing protein n=1 Tax=Strongyloides stercoralis TaxID=6248 RepID=A0A0K0ENU6_STRER
MDNYYSTLNCEENDKINSIIENLPNYLNFDRKSKRYGTINGINLRDMNISSIFKDLNNLNCEKEESTRLLNKIDSMNDEDFNKLTEIIELDNLKLKESIYLNRLLYYPDKIFQNKLNRQGKIFTEKQQLFLYKQLLEQQEIILKRENELLYEQLKSIEKIKSFQNNVEKLNKTSTNSY